MNPDTPFAHGHGHHGWEDGSLALFPMFGTFLVLLLLALTALYLWRQGKLSLPSGEHRPSPEDEARRILAERFARGDIDSDDFMERASILNWTPGNDTVPARAPGRRR